MKITILQGAFFPVPPELGGAVEKMWFALSKEFSKLGHSVHYISRLYEKLPENEIIEGVFHIRIKGYDAPASSIKMKIFDLLYSIQGVSKISESSDIIISNTFWSPIISKRNTKKKFFVDVARVPKGQMRFYKGVARLRANSNFVASKIQKELDKHKLKTPVCFIPNPLPFIPLGDVDFNRKKNVILYTGRIHPEKGLELLIKAFKLLNTDWLLKIVGPYEFSAGGGGTNYFKSLKTLAKGHNIEFTGPVYDMDILNEYYAESAVFAYPSIAELGETFGLAPLEAMAWGCIPVVSALSCFQDFIIHHDNGIIFDHRDNKAVDLLENTLRELIGNKPLRQNLGSKALDVRKTHSVSRIAEDFIKEFEKVCFENAD